MNSTTLDELIS